MSLILVFHNQQKEPGPLQEDASYHVWVGVGDGTAARTQRIAEGRVEHHQRSTGWRALVQRFLDEYEEDA